MPDFSETSLPAISIVMPSYNQATFIEASIRSVLSQDYPKRELIVVDGGSTDGTQEILKTFGAEIKWVSEKDKGQSDAINKGCCMATGDILAWLNSDDVYEPGAFRRVGEYFRAHPEAMWVFGHCRIIDERGGEIRRAVTRYKAARLRRYRYESLLVENYISQMGVFFRRSAFQAAGGLDISRRYAMDYDLWLRFGKKSEPGFIDHTLGAFRMYPDTKSMSRFGEQFAEDLEVASKYTDSKWFVFLHRLNNLKIVLIYRIMNKFRCKQR